MRTYMDCLPCFMQQALEAVRMVTDDVPLQERLLRRILSEAAEFSFELPPPVLGRSIHRIVREGTGNPDPYLDAKRRSNELAGELLAQIRDGLEEGTDLFELALRLAIAGNVIDLGAKSGHDASPAAVEAELERALAEPLPRRAVQALRRAVDRAETILYLTDNAGEIVFDRFFIEQFPPGRTTAAVRGGPIINDATMEDAAAVNMAAVADVMSSGTATPGTVLDDCSDEFRARFRAADVVIAKGQGNYETLSETDRPVFFLLRVKCPVLARDTGQAVGRLVIIAPEVEATG